MPHVRHLLRAFLILPVILSSAAAAPAAVPRDNTRVAGVPASNVVTTAVLRLPSIPTPLSEANVSFPAGSAHMPIGAMPKSIDAMPGETRSKAGLMQLRSWSLSAGIRFTENRGQVADTEGRPCPDIRFVADARGALLYFTPTSVSTVFNRTEKEATRISEATGKSVGNAGSTPRQPMKIARYRMDLHFEGANPDTRIHGVSELEGYSNYYLAHCPDGITHLKSYAKLIYENIYDNIDLVYSASQRRVKYEFVVRPGGDPSDIRLRYEGAIALRQNADGGLTIHTPLGSIEEEFPHSYQGGDAIESRFDVDVDMVRFDIGEYDGTRSLIIDPWATYCGGSDVDNLFDMACDAAGNTIALGRTIGGANFPLLNAYQPTYAGGFNDAVIVKYNAMGVMQWSTYYGGSSQDLVATSSSDLAVDGTGNPAICLTTLSHDLPVTPGAFQTTNHGTTDGALVKFTAGGIRDWATYFGGSVEETYTSVAFDSNNDIVFVGNTYSSDLPVLNAYQPVKVGEADNAACKFSAAGQLLWSTYLGGSGLDVAHGVVTLSDNSVAITGLTSSPNYPVQGAFQGILNGNDAFLTKLSSSGALVWSTYFGGSGAESANGVCRDAADNIIFVGYVYSTDFPVAGAMQSTHGGGGQDGFIAKFTSGGVRVWSTYFGGSSSEEIRAVACGSGNSIYVCGWTGSTDFPTRNAFQPTMNSFNEGFCACISEIGVLTWSTFYGGSGDDALNDVSVGQGGEAIFCGSTNSTDIFVQNAQQPVFGGVGDGIIVTISPVVHTPVTAPTNLTAAALSHSSVLLGWTDNSDNETSFIIEHRIGAGTWLQIFQTPANQNSATITGLLLETEYSFRVKGVNPSYESDWSNIATATTLSFPAPGNLQASASSSEAIGLTWSDNSIGEDGFIVEMQQGGSPWSITNTTAANITQVTVHGLQPVTPYNFRVHAFDDGLVTPYSNTAGAVTLQYLKEPGNLTASLLSANSARLAWEDRSDGETGFEIEARIGSGDWTLLHTAAADATEHVASGLAYDVDYGFRVRAVGDNAASSWSNEASLSTRTIPNAPLNFTAQATSHSTIALAWERGSTNETGYEMERKEGSGAWTLAHIAGAGVTTLQDDNLKPSTQYTYRIRAVNSMGPSLWSDEAGAMTQAVPVPLKPIGFAVAATGHSSVHMTWVAPSPQYQSSFEIHESLTGNEADFTRVTPDATANATSYDRTGLQSQTTYYYRIRALNTSGSSAWSNVVSATTQQLDPNLPGDPFNARAVARNMTEIEITWDMASPSKEDGFEIEQSMTGNAGDFTCLNPNPVQGARAYTASGLQPATKYWYRLRAFNSHGYSLYSNIASATTQSEPISQQLADAMQAKEALFPGLENLIADGDAEIAALRTLFGDYPRGYDEALARALIASWRTGHPNDQATAAEAFGRYTFFEQALNSGYRDTECTPPVEGAWEISREASGAPAMLTKDACALALAWASQRNALGAENPYVDAAVEDLLLPVSDGAETMFGLMGANNDDVVNAFTEQALRDKGEISGLTTRSLLSVLEYWQERMAGRYYVPATQQTIAAFAEMCEQLDIGGTRQSAIAKRDGFVLAVRERTNALSLGYTPYAGVCTGLDAAYTINQTLAPTVEIFLQRLTQLRPRLVDGMYKAITDADIPIERFLYLTSPEDIPGLEPLQFSLMKTGNAIYHPEIPGAPGASSDGNGARLLDSFGPSATKATQPDPAIESDRSALIALREKVVAADNAYAVAQFNALRMSGREMTAAVERMERPLFGIAPADMYQQAALRENYYGTLARSNLLKTRRTVLSVALADYTLSPTPQKQSALVAEIDSIIGPLDGVLSGIENLIGGQAGTMITLPVLSLANADIVRDEAAGPTRCRLRFAVTNAGGATAGAPQANLSILTEGVTAQGATSFTFGDLAISASAGDSLALDIPANTAAVTLSAVLRSGGGIFTDRRALAVPPLTTEVEGAAVLPVSCILHQNHPNPSRPVTTIRFTLPRATAVTLVVTDVFGRETARLCEAEHRATGTHSVTFDARNLSSGVYFYRLESEGAVQVRKMVLMR